MTRIIDDLDELAKEIAEHSYQKHILEKKEHENKSLGIELNITTPEQFQGHIRETLEDEKTQCFRVEQGVQQGTLYFYNDQTNTYIMVPSQEDLEPTAFRPEDHEKKFEIKKNRATDEQGYEPEIQHGIYELVPELKREQELSQDSDNPKSREVSEAGTTRTEPDGEPRPELSPTLSGIQRDEDHAEQRKRDDDGRKAIIQKETDYAAIFGQVSPSLANGKELTEAQRARFERAAKFLTQRERGDSDREQSGEQTDKARDRTRER